jgi:hypothetical protein
MPERRHLLRTSGVQEKGYEKGGPKAGVSR